MKPPTAQIIDGKLLAEKIILELKAKVSHLAKAPGLATVLIGDNAASTLFVKNKKKACLKVGITFHEYLCGKKDFYPQITQAEILKMIDWLNKDEEIDGIIVQLPLPKKFNTQKIINRIDPKKDVDGFHPDNAEPNSPLIGAIRLALMFPQKNLKDNKTIIVSKNPIFSSPLAQALKKDGLDVTIIKPDDKELTEKLKTADIVISVAGKKYLIKKSMIKKDAIVIDAGTNLMDKNHWVGDVDPSVSQVASYLTPVPGGIGPLTVVMLLKNTYDLAQKNQKNR
ncbi:MAG: hypothetical protein A3A24_03300 [Candidatus Buchananbacteria bacterium RIFCSPLOWO2_01_FULL_46_12]|uniref:Bifunctional protein FolD n=2 Tax=Candidatus Buchananiibacteriota TaxID=1817903 RepID=A0A1G1YRE8_9BACT|nr:MAG: hypothetical protein A2744_00785 [Candidatus Buchananbacteria bacterium RIFCSPHIGHO2_01_FULL_44_11]OGY54925.1 MAG: hypothetical protein A3A24_03300 [Candidatus Buchananbacteria bacterium RIFCSPLOWO2_01_FULL_46_12]